MGRDISLKSVKLFRVTLLLVSFEGLISCLTGFLDHLNDLISRLPGFLDELNFDFSIDKTFVFLDILVYDLENVFVFWPKAVE